MHNLLPAEIPDVRMHLIVPDLNGPFCDIDTGSSFEFFVLVGDESMNERCLTYSTSASLRSDFPPDRD